MLVAVVLQDLRGGKVHIGLHVVIREVGAVAVLPQGRVRLDLEGIAGHVLRLEAQDVLERAAPAGERLVRQAEHQVEREVGKARLARADDGHARLLVGMRTAEALEHVVLIGLHADGDAVEARANQPLEPLRRDAVGVGLERDLGVRAEVEALLQLVENFFQILRAEEARRTAAEIDGVDRVVRREAARFADVVGQRLQVLVRRAAIAAAAEGVEVAVFALALAEGDVDVNAQRLAGIAAHDQPPILSEMNVRNSSGVPFVKPALFTKYHCWRPQCRRNRCSVSRSSVMVE